MTFAVRFTTDANDDLERLLDFLLERAETLEAVDLAQVTIDAVQRSILDRLGNTPFGFRKSGDSPTRRELILPYGATGYVALYEIMSSARVLVLAVRHQLERDYH